MTYQIFASFYMLLLVVTGATGHGVKNPGILTLRPVTTQCLEYEPKLVSLSGVIVRETHPGPPNFESVANGDEPKSKHATLGRWYSTARICARIRLDDSANPPNGSWGIVKVQPTKACPRLNPPNGSWGIVKVQPQSLIAVGEGRALTIPQLPLGGLGKSSFVGVGRALTIPQLPLGGFGPCSSPLSWRTWLPVPYRAVVSARNRSMRPTCQNAERGAFPPLASLW